MHYKLITISLIFNIIFSDSNIEYLWPTDASNTITTVFGDKRSRRFHAGIDVRTYGQIGHDLYAIESGYVARISINAKGYGKALYLKLQNGDMAVYAHLDYFNKRIEQIIQKHREKLNKNFIDIYFDNNEILVEKGDIIGFAGDTGSLSGPHLHFEIRDQNGNPKNPLKYHYSIKDDYPPIANSIAIIPLDSTCFINGKQKYNIFDLTKINENKYVLEDTLSVIGNFGIAIDVIDEVNDQPFNFGIYNIILLIDGREIYNIEFDKYAFNNDPLIYKEIDFHLLQKESKKFHRLFVNNNKKLNFIKNDEISSINLDENYHNIQILVYDNNKNKIVISAIFKGDASVNKPLNLFINNGEYYLKSKDKNLDKFNFNISTRYKDSILQPLSYIKIDSLLYKINNIVSPFDVINYTYKENGIKSSTRYLSFSSVKSEKINGNFKIQAMDNGAIIEFIEDFYTGYEYKFKIIYNDDKEYILDTYRSSLTEISSKILGFDRIKNIKELVINYKSSPEIQFSEKVNGDYIDSSNDSLFSYKNFIIDYNENSFYNDLFLWIKDTTMVIDDYNIIDSPIIISPSNMPFKNKINVFYDKLEEQDNMFGLYTYTGKEWVIVEHSKNNKINAEISTGGIFAILSETVPPIVKNISPASNSTYKEDDLNIFKFNLYDELSNIDYENIEITIDGKKYFYDYIPYRKLVRCNKIKNLGKGIHSFNLKVSDKLNNEKIINHNFYIK